MRRQKNTEDDESGLEAVEKLAYFGNECVSKRGGGGCPNRQATKDSKGRLTSCCNFFQAPCNACFMQEFLQ